MESVDSISVAVSGIDIETVEALDNRRMVGFINKFICDTASFLNQFAGEAEHKLQAVQHKIIRIDANLRILEAKLASIPPVTGAPPSNVAVGGSEMKSSSPSSAVDSSQPVVAAVPSSVIVREDEERSPCDDPLTAVTERDNKSSAEESVEEMTSDSWNPRNDPVFAKYFKMIAVGVPIAAVKLKMSSEGLDPSVLDIK